MASQKYDRHLVVSRSDNVGGDATWATISGGAPAGTTSTREVAAPPARETWEYRTELLERGFLGWRSEQLDLRALQERLDELGQDGWELVHASWNHRVRSRHGGHVLLFKRQKA